MTFDNLLSRTDFKDIMQKILKSLESAYNYPVDIEFTVNFKSDGAFQLNLLQCRPLQTKGLGRRVEIPRKIPKENIVFESSGNFLGGNIMQAIDKIVYVDPQAYIGLATQSEKYDIARTVGEINRNIEDKEKVSVMLLGPGRWGTTTPSLGVPASFAEINNMTVLGEIAFATTAAVPELSFGTHFFQDLVETGIFYLAIFPQNHDVYINQAFFDSLPRVLNETTPQYRKYDHVIKIFNAKSRGLKIAADIVSQKVVCYLQ